MINMCNKSLLALILLVVISILILLSLVVYKYPILGVIFTELVLGAYTAGLGFALYKLRAE